MLSRICVIMFPFFFITCFYYIFLFYFYFTCYFGCFFIYFIFSFILHEPKKLKPHTHTRPYAHLFQTSHLHCLDPSCMKSRHTSHHLHTPLPPFSSTCRKLNHPYSTCTLTSLPLSPCLGAEKAILTAPNLPSHLDRAMLPVLST